MMERHQTPAVTSMSPLVMRRTFSIVIYNLLGPIYVCNVKLKRVFLQHEGQPCLIGALPTDAQILLIVFF
jgi:hypothetical protein